MIPSVQLDAGEMAVAASLAALRSAMSRLLKTYDQRMDDKKSGYEIDLIGIIGEIAFAKKFNVYPDLSISPRSGSDDAVVNGKTIDVKSTDLKNGRLLATLNKEKHMSDIYVLAIVDCDRVSFPGYATKELLFVETRKKDLGKGVGYVMDQSELMRFK
jgi:hypothetical protein